MIIILDQERINKKLFLNDKSLKFQKKLFMKNLVGCAYGDEMRWDEMRWDEMRWDEMRWDEWWMMISGLSVQTSTIHQGRIYSLNYNHTEM